MKNFKSKKQAFDYIKNKFAKKSELILIRGSTAKGKIKRFSDIDVEIYTSQLKKPDYEIILVNDNEVLISTYFYKFIDGRVIKTPKNVLILHGNYNLNIAKSFDSKEHSKKDKYNAKGKIVRECQLAVDFLFRYLRKRNRADLESVQRRLK